MCNSDNNQMTKTTLSSVDNDFRNEATAECGDNSIKDRLGAPTNEIDLRKIPISALRSESRIILSKLLNSEKVFLENGIYRDWRGVLLCALPQSNLSDICSKQDRMKEVLNIWYTEDTENATLAQLQSILQKIDRWDVLEDTNNFAKDCSEYSRMKLNVNALPSKINALDKFDALVLFADEDSIFGEKMVIELEKRDLKIFEKGRDLLAGAHENETLRQQISDCCRHLIVIFSNEFFNSPVNHYLATYAHWKGVTDTKRLVVPCVLKTFNLPEPWNSYRVLRYNEDPKAQQLYNFWDKLVQSVSRPSGTNDNATRCFGIKDKTLESAKSFPASVAEEVPTKQENKTVSLTTSSRIDQLLSKLPEIVSEVPCRSTKIKDSVKKKKNLVLKFCKRSKDRAATKAT